MLERTITQNSTLYLAQHKLLKQRYAAFRFYKSAAEKDRTSDLRQPAFSKAYLVPRFFQDDGR